MSKITIKNLKEKKQKGEKITVLTAYDAQTAKILNEAGIDIVLVGDSVGMVKMGYDNTLGVSVTDMIVHCKAAKAGNTNSLLVVDMPFSSYETSPKDAVINADRLIKEGGAEAVKVEGCREIVESIKALVKADIPVMGHLGLTPQSVVKFGGYKVQGRDENTAKQMIEDAKTLEKLGVFAIVLECIPGDLAKKITSSVSVPTIGIGAGLHCDGQVLVIDDMLGLSSGRKLKFVKQYADLKPQIKNAVEQSCKEVKENIFPAEENTFK